MIDNNVIEQVKGQADIVSVISTYVQLKAKGPDMVGKCPFHTEKTASFTVSRRKGIYKCFGCGKSGDVVQFIMDHDKMSYPEAISKLANLSNISITMEPAIRKEYTRPQPRLEKLSKRTLNWFEEERKISNDTLLRMCVTEAREWMPQYKTEVPAICFNYYRGKDLVNIKFRGPEKSFKLAKDAELVFYNLNALEGVKEIIIVEGEIDALTAVECARYNVISVPNGAGVGNMRLEYLDNCYDQFESVEKIILATDDDHPGRLLRDELCRRLGVDRCYQVQYPEGCKDLNATLQSFGREAVQAVIDNPIQWPIKGIITMDGMFDTLTDWYQNGYPQGACSRLPGLDEYLTFPPGQLTVITGIPGHGKDEYCNWIMTGLSIHEKWPWGLLGFEETPAETVTKLQEKIVKKSFAHRKDLQHRMTPAEFEYSIGFIDSFFHIVNPEEIEGDIDTILELFTLLVKRHGIKGAYINPWNWIESNRPPHTSETEYISGVLTKIIRWARKYAVHVFLVAHTTKVGKDKDGKFIVPNLYMISGSANFYNKVHNGITVYRDYEKGWTTVYIQKVKQSWCGQLGWITYRFNTLSRQYEYLECSLKPEDKEIVRSQASQTTSLNGIDLKLPYPDDKDDTDEEPF